MTGTVWTTRFLIKNVIWTVCHWLSSNCRSRTMYGVVSTLRNNVMAHEPFFNRFWCSTVMNQSTWFIFLLLIFHPPIKPLATFNFTQHRNLILQHSNMLISCIYRFFFCWGPQWNQIKRYHVGVKVKIPKPKCNIPTVKISNVDAVVNCVRCRRPCK